METRRNLARDHSNSEWSLHELQDTILKEIQVLETGLNNVSQHKQNPPTPKASFHTNTGRNPHPTYDSSDSRKKHQCVYCSGSHTPSICDVVTDQQKPLAIVKQKRLFFNCLAHHKISQCNSKFICRHCKRKHHTTLYINIESNDKNARNLKTQLHWQLSPPLLKTYHFNWQVTVFACHIRTAVATVSSSKVQVEAKILFGKGSQRSFISHKLANSL